MIEQGITEFLNAITARFWGMFDWIADPFWGWVIIAVVIIAAVIAITYFFGSLFTWLRPIGGVILILVTFGLYAYAKGEADQKARDAKRRKESNVGK